MTLQNYIPLCNAIVLLMQPLVEIVIHDLESNTICYINGDLSKRGVGDSSLLKAQELETDLNKIIYPQINFDGRLIKSISVDIEEKWLICINCDISIFNQIKTLSEQFLNYSYSNKPDSLFKDDWQHNLHITMHTFLKDRGWNFDELNNSQKKTLIKHLFEAGAFHEKNAADYIAKIISVGRATIFKYLKEWRKV